MIDEIDLPDDFSEDNPELVLGVFGKLLDGIDDPDSVVELASLFATEGVNIWRVIDENPDVAAELANIDVEITDSLIEEFEEIVDAYN